MDNRKLSPQELKEMKAFIISRSARFAEPSILIEIMDHFACKTEEILNESKPISFKEAMHKAHESFGVRGFAPISAAWEEHTFKRYKKWRKQENLHILLSIHGVGLVAFGMLMAKLFLLLLSKKMLLANGMEIMLPILMIYAISVYPISTKKSVDKMHPLLYGKALEANYSIFIAPFILIPFMNEMNKISPYTAAFVIATLSITFGINIIINKRLLKKVTQESIIAEQQMTLI